MSSPRARTASAEPSSEALSSTSTSLLGSSCCALRSHRVQAAHQQLAAVGVDHAEGDLDVHPRIVGLREAARRRPLGLHAALRPRAVRGARPGRHRRRAVHEPLSLRRAAGARRIRAPRAVLPLGPRRPGLDARAGRSSSPSTSPTCCVTARRARPRTSSTSSGSRCRRSTAPSCRAGARSCSPPTTFSRPRARWPAVPSSGGCTGASTP